MFRASDFEYELPPELIAQTPAEPRDSARLLVLDRQTGSASHHVFSDLPWLLRPGDLLVANRTRVIAARLQGVKPTTGGRVEVLLLREIEIGSWEAFVRPARRLRPGARVSVTDGRRELVVEIGRPLTGGKRVVRALGDQREPSVLLEFGTLPLPPYVKRWRGDPERYQTVYADRSGSVAAPTAGLHFTPGLFEQLSARGVGAEFVTLHVGADTFRPIKTDTVEEHEMHSEWAEVPAGALAAADATRRHGGRVVAVGTTTVRALESAAAQGASGAGNGWVGWTDLFIKPGHRFQSVDALITNFHLPRSTLLLLVSALASREVMLEAYQEAIRQRYRFYSFGDAMLIL